MENILLADAHVLTRLGMSVYVHERWPGAQILEADNFEQTLKLVKRKEADLVIIDSDLPGGNGQQMIGLLRATNPMLRIIVLSRQLENFYEVHYIKQGADGYIRVDAGPKEIRESLKMVADGNKAFSSLAYKMFVGEYNRAKQRKQVNPLDMLSSRETEVLKYIMSGLSIKDIGDMLCLQISTVSTYKKRVMGKLNTNNLMALRSAYDTLKKEKILELEEV